MKSEKQTIKYTQTTVPASMRSPYWRYFGFPADSANNILTRQKIICTLCNAAVTYNKNTSNLRTHLISRHPEQLHQMHQQQQQQCASADDGDDGSAEEQNLQCDQKRQLPLSTANGPWRMKLASGEMQLKRSRYGSDLSAADCGSDVALKSKQSDAENVTVAEAVTDETTGAYLTSEFKQTCAAVLLAADELGANMVQQADLPMANASDFKYFNATSLPVDVSVDAEGVEAAEVDSATADEVPTVDAVTVAVAVPAISATTKEEEEEAQEQYSAFSYSPNDSQVVSPKHTVLHSNSGNNVSLLAEMLITDLLPFSTLQGNGWQQLVLPVDKILLCAVERMILADYECQRQAINAHLQQLTIRQPYSLSMEFYKNVEELEILNIYVNYMRTESDEHNELISVLYQTIYSDDDTDLNEILTKAMHLQYCGAIVTNRPEKLAVNLFASEHDIPIAECVESVLSRCLDQTFQLAAVRQIFKQICQLQTVHVFDSKLQNIPELFLPCSRSKINYLEAIIDNSQLNELQHTELFDELRAFLAHINPVKLTLDAIIAEPLPLCTIIQPMLVRLMEQHLWNVPRNDSQCLAESRKYLTEQLEFCVKRPLVSMATFFDARFQHELSSSSAMLQIFRQDIHQAIGRRFQRLIAQIDACEQQQRGNSRAGAASKSNLELFFDRIYGKVGDVSTNANATVATTLPSLTPTSTVPKTGIDVEFDRYRNEPALDLEQCPIGWWQMCAYKYKRLHKIANYYLCVPCCVTRWPQQQQQQQYCNIATEANERAVWRQKRFALRLQRRAEICLWYLHYNRLIYDKLKTIV